jgi:Replication-relaxation
MKTDTLGRRTRDKRQPTSTSTHHVTDRDLEWLSFLHRHGGRLPTSYLHESSKHTHKCRYRAQIRLRDLFNEMKLIDRPFQQFETLDPRYNELVHEVSPKGLAVLKDENLYSDYAPTMRGSFKHQVMLSCVSASFELNARQYGFVYTPQHVLLERLGKDHKIELAKDVFTPDEVFMLSKDGKNLLIFLEIDRGTEPTESDNKRRKSWTRSVAQYREFIGHKQYKSRFGVDCGALLMVVTVSAAKQAGILDAVAKEFDGPCNYILTHYLPEFGRQFHPPKLLDMLAVGWKRYQHPDFKLV